MKIEWKDAVGFGCLFGAIAWSVLVRLLTGPRVSLLHGVSVALMFVAGGVLFGTPSSPPSREKVISAIILVVLIGVVCALLDSMFWV